MKGKTAVHALTASRVHPVSTLNVHRIYHDEEWSSGSMFYHARKDAGSK